jgi:hypothetical protein
MELHRARHTLFACVAAIGLLTVAASSQALADDDTYEGAEHGRGTKDAQLCALGSAAVGQPGSVICKSIMTGATTQSVPVGATVSKAGGISGSLVRYDNHVLVTNQAQGAVLFDVMGGQLRSARTLATDGEDSLSGALTSRGAYVLTGKRLLFFRMGDSTASSSQPLMQADGSAAHVVIAGGYAYVSEKSGSLEAFALGRGGDLRSGATPVAGVPAGIIVGITAVGDQVVAPIAHLASNFDLSAIPVVRGLDTIQIVPTKEVAACWAGSDGNEACVTNPGSMTVSCGQVGSSAFTSYTSAAATLSGETAFDVDMKDSLVGILGMRSGAPVLLTFVRSKRGGDFLQAMNEIPLGTAAGTGAMLLPPM